MAIGTPYGYKSPTRASVSETIFGKPNLLGPDRTFWTMESTMAQLLPSGLASTQKAANIVMSKNACAFGGDVLAQVEAQGVNLVAITAMLF